MYYVTPINFSSSKTLYLGEAPGQRVYSISRRDKLSSPSLFPPTPPYRKLIEEDVEFLKKLNLSYIVVLLTGEELQRMPYPLLQAYEKELGVKVVHFPIEDYGVPRNMKEFSKLITYILQALGKGNVLIHCAAGMGRTGLVATAALIRLRIPLVKALPYLRNKRPGLVERKTQYQFLQEYERQLHGSTSNEIPRKY